MIFWRVQISWILNLCGLNVTLALVVFAGDTSDGVLLLLEGNLVRGLLPLLGHGLDGGTSCKARCEWTIKRSWEAEGMSTCNGPICRSECG